MATQSHDSKIRATMEGALRERGEGRRFESRKGAGERGFQRGRLVKNFCQIYEKMLILRFTTFTFVGIIEIGDVLFSLDVIPGDSASCFRKIVDAFLALQTTNWRRS